MEEQEEEQPAEPLNTYVLLNGLLQYFAAEKRKAGMLAASRTGLSKSLATEIASKVNALSSVDSLLVYYPHLKVHFAKNIFKIIQAFQNS